MKPTELAGGRPRGPHNEPLVRCESRRDSTASRCWRKVGSRARELERDVERAKASTQAGSKVAPRSQARDLRTDASLTSGDPQDALGSRGRRRRRRSRARDRPAGAPRLRSTGRTACAGAPPAGRRPRRSRRAGRSHGRPGRGSTLPFCAISALRRELREVVRVERRYRSGGPCSGAVARDQRGESCPGCPSEGHSRHSCAIRAGTTGCTRGRRAGTPPG